jgi:hypothetical protein
MGKTNRIQTNEEFLGFQLEERLLAGNAELTKYHLWWTEMSACFRKMTPEMADKVCDLVARAHPDLTTKQELLNWCLEGTL